MAELRISSLCRVSYWWIWPCFTYMLLKKTGNIWLQNLWKNFKHCLSNISMIFKMLSLLNNGSVWALNLELVIARTAYFCNLWILELLNPQDKTPKCKCGDIRLLYIVFKTSFGRKCFSFWRTPTVHPIFDAIFPTWDDHVMVSLIV